MQHFGKTIGQLLRRPGLYVLHITTNNTLSYRMKMDWDNVHLLVLSGIGQDFRGGDINVAALRLKLNLVSSHTRGRGFDAIPTSSRNLRIDIASSDAVVIDAVLSPVAIQVHTVTCSHSSADA
jgi:hypothetical protein